MVTIKSYSDLEQSKVLAEILPFESADMCYPRDAFAAHYDKEPVCHYRGIGLAHPCWSLASLLGVLPREYTNSKNQVCSLHIDIEDSETPYLIWYVNPEHEGSIVEIKTKEYSNLIDACYEVVLKLNELNLL
jgi:hypothetical protein